MIIMMSAAASPVAAGIIRHLQMLGHEVIGHDSSPHIASTAADRHVRSPKAEGVAYLRFLENFNRDLYLPFLDEELLIFGIFGGPADCLCSPKDTLVDLCNKVRQQYHLGNAGLPIAPEVDFVVKPEHGRGGKGVFKRETLGTNVIAQRRLNGPEYTIDVLTDLDGEFLFAVPRERLARNGVSTIGRIRMDQDLIELAQTVCQKVKFAGPLNIQVIVEDGEPYIIEVNPRLSGSCMFTVMAGWDILDASIRVFEGRPFIAPEVEEITVRRTYVEERI